MTASPLKCLVGGRVVNPAVKRTEAEERFKKACWTFTLLCNFEDPWFERQVSVKEWFESSTCFSGVHHDTNAHWKSACVMRKNADVFVFKLCTHLASQHIEAEYSTGNVSSSTSFYLYGKLLVPHPDTSAFAEFRTNRRDLREQRASCKKNRNCKMFKKNCKLTSYYYIWMVMLLINLNWVIIYITCLIWDSRLA